MLRRYVEAGLIAPFLMTLFALAVLVGLGTWQLERLAWKQGLIEAVEAGLKADPVVVTDAPESWATVAGQEYRPVRVTGRFKHGEERHVFAQEGSSIGWHVYTPLELAGGSIVFVNRGFVPYELKDPVTRLEGQPKDDVTISGLVRQPGKRGWFEADPDVNGNVWYWRDLQAMSASLPATDQSRSILPFFVDAKAEVTNPGGWPRGGVTRLAIPNRHLEYALTWYGLAGALVAVFLAYAWPRLRAKPKL